MFSRRRSRSARGGSPFYPGTPFSLASSLSQYPFFDTLEVTPFAPRIAGSVSKQPYHEKGRYVADVWD